MQFKRDNQSILYFYECRFLYEPITSLQAKAFSGLNISFSLIGIISVLVTLCLKTTLFYFIDSYGKCGWWRLSKCDQDKEELESDEVPKSVFAKGELQQYVRPEGRMWKAFVSSSIHVTSTASWQEKQKTRRQNTWDLCSVRLPLYDVHCTCTDYNCAPLKYQGGVQVYRCTMVSRVTVKVYELQFFV